MSDRRLARPVLRSLAIWGGAVLIAAVLGWGGAVLTVAVLGWIIWWAAGGPLP